QLQAAIAACHARAASWEATEWERIVDHYRALAALAPSPVIELNLAVAVGLAEGPAAGLAALDELDASALRDYHLLPAARADFLRRLGHFAEGAGAYRRALRLAAPPPPGPPRGGRRRVSPGPWPRGQPSGEGVPRRTPRGLRGTRRVAARRAN